MISTRNRMWSINHTSVVANKAWRATLYPWYPLPFQMQLVLALMERSQAK